MDLTIRDPYRPSYATRYIEVDCDGNLLANATGFLVRHADSLVLVTNAHVFRGLAQDRSTLHSSGAVPDTVRIRHIVTGEDGSRRFEERAEALTADYTPLWFEHPDHGRTVDVAALPLTRTDDVWEGGYDPWAQQLVDVGVGDDVFVVGYPFGLSADGFAIWTRAMVATEFYSDYDDLPCFLVDARTRSGQSGSPVLFFRPGGYFDRSGTAHLPGLTMDPPAPGEPIDPDGPRPDTATEQLLGVYSGRVRGDADLGFVWRAAAIAQIVEARSVAQP